MFSHFAFLDLGAPELIIVLAIILLLFRYVLGGAIHVPGKTTYIDYLMSGIFIQTPSRSISDVR